MSNLKILVKNNFNMLVGRMQGKKKRLSTNTAIALLVLGMVGLFALYSLQAWSMFEGLGKLGLGKLCVFHGIITTLTTLLILGIMRVTGKTKTNDSDFLLSLPIKKSDIIISKLIGKYLFDLFFSFTLLLPFIVLYEITAPAFSVNVLIFGLITVLLLPLLSVGISQIMEFVVVRLFNRAKHGNVLKSLIPAIIYIGLLTLMIIKTSGYGSVQFESMESYFQDRWFSNQILTFIFDQSLLSIFVFLGITFVPAAVGIILQINIFGKNFGVYTNTKKSVELTKCKSPLGHLQKKEIAYYFTTPAYLVNTIIGPILILVFSVAMPILGIDNLLATLQISIANENLAFVIAGIINFCISMTCISCVSISLEGKTLWLLHSLPISATQIFLSKMVVPMILIVPTIVVASVVFGIVLHSLLAGVLIFLITLIFLMLTNILGLLINLWVPKLNWENEVQVVKQSLSVLLSMVFNFVLAVVPVVIYLIFEIDIKLVAMITLGLYVVCLITFTTLLFTKGKKRFYRINQ